MTAPRHVATIDLAYDERAKVWLATSRGDLGLSVEATALDELMRTVADLLPLLTSENGPSPLGTDAADTAALSAVRTTAV